MKICIPTKDDRGVDSVPYGHFGSAPYFIIADIETGRCITVDNQDRKHEHGKCLPTEALDGKEVDAVIVGGIGGRALTQLNDKGITVFQSGPGTVADNLAAWKVGVLREMNAGHACSGHGHS